LEVLNKVLGFLPPINVGKWGKVSCGREQGSGVELRRPRQGQIRGRRRVLK